ncbi:MAG: hypothetical protein RSC24_06470 [Clostridium sp.]
MNKEVYGYKFTNADMTCGDFKYELGIEYEIKGDIKPCENGFHFCEKFDNCYIYYNNIKGDKRLFKVAGSGEIILKDGKYICSKIKFLEEITDIEGLIRENQDNVNWYIVSSRQKLSQEFIREFKDKVCWWDVSRWQRLTENAIREFKDNIEWSWVSKYQTLSEDFIREFKDRVDWGWISSEQELSEGFIKEFKDRVKED